MIIVVLGFHRKQFNSPAAHGCFKKLGNFLKLYASVFSVCLHVRNGPGIEKVEKVAGARR